MALFFKPDNVELWAYTESNTVNMYGEPEVTYTLIGTYPCDFQPINAADTVKEFGKLLEDTYRIFLDYNVPVNDKMILRIVGSSDTYELIGSPSIFKTTILKHIELTVQKQRKPHNLPEPNIEE